MFIIYKPSFWDEFIDFRTENALIAMSNPAVDSNDSLNLATFQVP